MTRTHGTWTALAAAALLALPGCRSAYYGAMEALGQHKRDILVDRVEEARDGQQEAVETFVDALERFRTVAGFRGGELGRVYDELSDELESCEERAEAVHERVDAIESVAEDLFDEWKGELDQYTNPDLRRQSEKTLGETRQRYGELIGAMHRAEKTMEPVLVAFRDQVLFLKHNLNAQAIASLQGNVAALEGDVAELVRDMQAAIAEANEFVRAMGAG
jgi:hypothetical protein